MIENGDTNGDIFWDPPTWYDEELTDAVRGSVRDAYKTVCRELGREARKKGRVVSLADHRFELGKAIESDYCMISALAFPDIRILPKFREPDLLMSIMEKYDCFKPREQLSFMAGFFEKHIPPEFWNEAYIERIMGKTFKGGGKYIPSGEDIYNMRKGYRARAKTDNHYAMIFPLNLAAIYDETPTISARWDIHYGERQGAIVETDIADFSRELFAAKLVDQGLRFLRSADPKSEKY